MPSINKLSDLKVRSLSKRGHYADGGSFDQSKCPLSCSRWLENGKVCWITVHLWNGFNQRFCIFHFRVS